LSRWSSATAEYEHWRRVEDQDGAGGWVHYSLLSGVRSVLVTNIDRASYLSTDGHPFYKPPGYEFKLHGSVQHNVNEYVSEKTVSRYWANATAKWHTNTAENFFSIFKRGVIGTYHHISEAHMHRYCREFDFRYNTRAMTDAERTVEALKGARGKRLMYRQPSSIAA